MRSRAGAIEQLADGCELLGGRAVGLRTDPLQRIDEARDAAICQRLQLGLGDARAHVGGLGLRQSELGSKVTVSRPIAADSRVSAADSARARASQARASGRV